MRPAPAASVPAACDQLTTAYRRAVAMHPVGSPNPMACLHPPIEAFVQVLAQTGADLSPVALAVALLDATLPASTAEADRYELLGIARQVAGRAASRVAAATPGPRRALVA